MASPSSGDSFAEYDGLREFARQAFVTGAAVTLPLIVTLWVLGLVVNFVSNQLDPVVGLLTSTTGSEPTSEVTIKLLAVGALFTAIFAIGAVAEQRPGKSGFATFFDTLVARIPGVGSLYRSIDEMSGLLLDSDTDSFQDVKLVEFPVEGSYALAFLTADTPDLVERDAGHESMVTLFLPMAPNPVMGGYVLHVSEDRVVDVDMTVEEGIQSIVTSGVATGSRSQKDLSDTMLNRLQDRLDATNSVVSMQDLERYASEASTQLGNSMQNDESTGGPATEDGRTGPGSTNGQDGERSP
jgi:uncharacterized membrane protein